MLFNQSQWHNIERNRKCNIRAKELNKVFPIMSVISCHSHYEYVVCVSNREINQQTKYKISKTQSSTENKLCLLACLYGYDDERKRCV